LKQIARGQSAHLCYGHSSQLVCPSASSVSEFEVPAVANSPDLSGLSVWWGVDDEREKDGGHGDGDIIRDDKEDLVLETNITMLVPFVVPTQTLTYPRSDAHSLRLA
jgi:hypothetical protein